MKSIKASFLVLALSATVMTGCGSPAAPALNSYPANIQAMNISNPVRNDNLQQLNEAIDFATGTKNTYNNYNVRFYIDGPQAYPEVEKAIAEAKESIYIEVFKYNPGAAGQRIAEALVKKARGGLDVKVL